MMALATLLLAAVAIPLAGGRLSNLARFEVRHGGAVVLLFVAQALARGRLPFGAESRELSIAAWAVISLILCLALLKQEDLVGAEVMVVGIALNLLVVLANGHMPVFLPDAEHAGMASGYYGAGNVSTLVPYLGDVLPLPGGWYLSLGDMLLVVGAVALVARLSVSEHNPVDRV